MSTCSINSIAVKFFVQCYHCGVAIHRRPAFVVLFRWRVLMRPCFRVSPAFCEPDHSRVASPFTATPPSLPPPPPVHRDASPHRPRAHQADPRTRPAADLFVCGEIVSHGFSLRGVLPTVDCRHTDLCFPNRPQGRIQGGETLEHVPHFGAEGAPRPGRRPRSTTAQ